MKPMLTIILTVDAPEDWTPEEVEQELRDRLARPANGIVRAVRFEVEQVLREDRHDRD